MIGESTSGSFPDDPDPQPLDAGLRAAFGPESSVAIARRGGSVMAVLEASSGVRSRIVLRDEPGPEPVAVETPPGEVSTLVPPDAGRYRVDAEIARGGIGVVLRGRDTDLGREVALKRLRAEHATNPALIRRLIEEAQIGGQLQHPGVLPVYELGLDESGRPYVAMKLIRGRTLADLLHERSDPDQDRRRFLGIFEQVCQTIAYAHARGVVHRDLKPLNIMVGAFGEVQVLDWGLAKVLDEAGSKSSDPGAPAETRTGREASSEAGSVLGTPAYMAPEQARGETEDLDERCDVFALGAILCEILTGRPPFEGSRADVIRQSMQGRLDDAFARLDRSSADPDLVELARRCLSPNRKDRPADAGAVARGVSEHLVSVEARARAAELAAAEARAKARAERRTRWVATVLAAALLGLAVLGGVFARAERDRRARIEAALAVLPAVNVKGIWLLGHPDLMSSADASQWADLFRFAREAAERSAAAAPEGPERQRTETLIEQLRAREDELRARAAESGSP